MKDLIGSAKKQDGLKAVEQLLEGAKESKTLDEPLPRFQQEQVRSRERRKLLGLLENNLISSVPRLDPHYVPTLIYPFFVRHNGK